MSKPFFYRIDIAELLDFATEPEGANMSLLQFAKELKRGQSDIPQIQKIIDEAAEFIEKKKNAAHKRWNAPHMQTDAPHMHSNARSSNRNRNRSSTEKKEKTFCAEQSSPPAEFSFILSDKSMFDVPNKILDQWADLYLGIDIRKELKKLVDWCEDNPRKRKTREGAMRFVRSWLNRADDRSREEADSFTMDDYLKQCGVSYGD